MDAITPTSIALLLLVVILFDFNIIVIIIINVITIIIINNNNLYSILIKKDLCTVLHLKRIKFVP